MRSDRIIARNRTNARKSTGPKTAEGRAAVAGNARRHGATARPDQESVATWLAIILDRPEITPDDLLPGDEIGYRALALAEAEVRVVATEMALREFEVGREEPSESLKDLGWCREMIVDELILDGGSEKEIKSAFSLLRRIARVEERDTLPGGKRNRLLQRYVREARAQRRRAFAAWVLAREEASVSA